MLKLFKGTAQKLMLTRRSRACKQKSFKQAEKSSCSREGNAAQNVLLLHRASPLLQLSKIRDTAIVRTDNQG